MASHPRFLIIDNSPCPYEVAPYAYLVVRRAKQNFLGGSIYRGRDAAPLLHRLGKRTQGEIHADPAYANISNPEGQSEHDLHSDAVARRGPVGRPLEDWEVGFDSGTNSEGDKSAIERAAAHYGLHVGHPYSRGVEGHHWHFESRPHPNRRLRKWKVVAVRAYLKRRSARWL